MVDESEISEPASDGSYVDFPPDFPPNVVGAAGFPPLFEAEGAVLDFELPLELVGLWLGVSPLEEDCEDLPLLLAF